MLSPFFISESDNVIIENMLVQWWYKHAVILTRKLRFIPSKQEVQIGTSCQDVDNQMCNQQSWSYLKVFISHTSRVGS